MTTEALISRISTANNRPKLSNDTPTSCESSFRLGSPCELKPSSERATPDPHVVLSKLWKDVSWQRTTYISPDNATRLKISLYLCGQQGHLQMVQFHGCQDCITSTATSQEALPRAGCLCL
eukprot:GHVH01015934.1.p1 GENE.GHVH01015934.1~~GHVH01015934.1.p1  ORF type:complete len:121 (+),score=4.86 GHVH01015934.1:168-530(+)